MLIELENHVVIFDEGHNMEDASRDAASFTINQDEIRTAIQDCEGVSHCGVEPYAHMELVSCLPILSLCIIAPALVVSHRSYFPPIKVLPKIEK